MMEKLYKNKYWLHDQYISQKKSTYEIGKECNCCNTTILYWLKKFNVNRRPNIYILKGRKFTEESKKKMSESHRGKKQSEESKKRISNTMKGHKNAWKGENVGYGALHDWINKYKQKTGICTICNKYKKTEWSNIDHSYKRNLNDFWELCHECHMSYDKLKFNSWKSRM